MTTCPINVSALAREHGVSRRTIRRRLAKGWRPAPPNLPTPLPMGLSAPEMAPGRDVVAAAPTSVGKAVPSSPSAHSANAPTHGRHGRFEVLPPTTHWTPGAAILTIIGLAIGFLALGI